MGNTQCACVEAKDTNEAVGDAPCSSPRVATMTPAEFAATVSQPLTDKEIELVESTWKIATGSGVEVAGVLLFKHIFTICPEALDLFSFKEEASMKTYETPGVKAHGVRVMTTVGTAVDGLRNLKSLAPVLKKLAIRHVGYGVVPSDYEVVGKALMLTMKDLLGAGFSDAVQIAWGKVWHVLSTTMREAGRPAFAQRQKEQAARDAPLSLAEIELVKDSWAQVAALGTETVGVELMKNMFAVAPELVLMFPFRSDWKNLYESPRLKAHGGKVVSTVTMAVDRLSDLQHLVPVLKEIGTKHVGYNVLKPHYDIVGGALIKTLSESLAAGFTKDTKAAWLKVWCLLSTTMMDKHYD